MKRMLGLNISYCGAEGFGKAQPISYQAQDLCRERENVRG